MYSSIQDHVHTCPRVCTNHHGPVHWGLCPHFLFSFRKSTACSPNVEKSTVVPPIFKPMPRIHCTIFTSTIVEYSSHTTISQMSVLYLSNNSALIKFKTCRFHIEPYEGAAGGGVGGRHGWGWPRICLDGPRARGQLRHPARSRALIRCALSPPSGNNNPMTTRAATASAAHNTITNVRAIARRLLLLELLRPHGSARSIILGSGAPARRARRGLPLPGPVRSGRHAARRYGPLPLAILTFSFPSNNLIHMQYCTLTEQ